MALRLTGRGHVLVGNVFPYDLGAILRRFIVRDFDGNSRCLGELDRSFLNPGSAGASLRFVPDRTPFPYWEGWTVSMSW